jgi:DNA-binding transcriptional regulator YdaS (Cro superfamily)
VEEPVDLLKITKDAVRSAGGGARVARVLGLTKGAISLWRAIPPKHLPAMVRLTGLHEWQLRPDLIRAPKGRRPAVVVD